MQPFMSQILDGDNTFSWPLGPGPLQILQQVLSGNFSALGVPTLDQLTGPIMDAQPGNATNNDGNTNPPGVAKPPNPIENPSTKDKICFYATAAVSYFTIATEPGALPAASVPSIITGGTTTSGEVGASS